MGKALEMYMKAKPGSGWTTDRIIKLAQALQKEGNDVAEYTYGLVMLATKPGQSKEVVALLAAMVEHEAEQKGKKVEVDERPDIL